jgi:hypothetical protein
MSENPYQTFVEHPRYGHRPRVTGLNPVRPERFKAGEPIIKFHWHSPPECRIPNTAVEADISKQNFTTFPVTHYFDVIRTCRGCRRQFIFFAEEQRHWYEDLGFPIDADCDRCVPCRKKQQGIARKRHRYEELVHVARPTDEERLEMADCCLSMIEASIFSPCQLERVRALLKRVGPRHEKRREKLLKRVRKLESASK